MPFTPLHIVFVWPILRELRNNRFFLVAGSLAPDIEIPIFYLLGFQIPRGFAHSIIGAFTIDALIAISISKLIYNWKSLRKTLGMTDAEDGSLFTIWKLSSIGALTHISIDYLHHSHNPIFWPIMTGYYEGPLVYLLGYESSTFLVHIISMFFFILIMFYSRSRLKLGFWSIISSSKRLYKVLIEPSF